MFIDSFSFRTPGGAVPWRRLAAGIVAAFAMGAGAAHAADGLTLDQALRLAQTRSRALVAQDATASAARDMAVAAGQRPDPTLKLGINNLPVNGADPVRPTRPFLTIAPIGLGAGVHRHGKLHARAAGYGPAG